MEDVQFWAWICMDLMTVLFTIYIVWHYARRGFIQTLYSALKWILSFFLIRWLLPPVTDWLKTTGLEMYFSQHLENWIGNAGSFGTEEFIEGLPLPQAIIDYLKANNNLTTYAEMGVNNAVAFVARTLADIAVNVIAILGLILLFQILFFLVGKALDLLSHLPILHSMNAALGGLLGIGMALIFLWVISAGIYIVSVIGQWPFLVYAMDETRILKFINQGNFLLQYAYNLKLQ